MLILLIKRYLNYKALRIEQSARNFNTKKY